MIKETNWVHLERRVFFVGYNENSKGYRIYGAGQREVKISHDVTFDEDMALRKVDNLPILRKDKEADTRKLDEKEDETMPEMEEPMDPIDPPRKSLPFLGRGSHGLGGHLMMPKDILHPEGLSLKVRSQPSIRDT